MKRSFDVSFQVKNKRIKMENTERSVCTHHGAHRVQTEVEELRMKCEQYKNEIAALKNYINSLKEIRDDIPYIS